MTCGAEKEYHGTEVVVTRNAILVSLPIPTGLTGDVSHINNFHVITIHES